MRYGGRLPSTADDRQGSVARLTRVSKLEGSLFLPRLRVTVGFYVYGLGCSGDEGGTPATRRLCGHVSCRTRHGHHGCYCLRRICNVLIANSQEILYYPSTGRDWLRTDPAPAWQRSSPALQPPPPASAPAMLPSAASLHSQKPST